jgi:YVTN family beta-propeller protein
MVCVFSPYASAEHAYAYDGDGAVFGIDTGTCQVVNQLPPQGEILGIAAGSKRVYFSVAFDNQVRVLDDATGQVLASIPVGNFPVGVALLPDESRLYVASAGNGNHGDGSVSVIDTASNAVVATLPNITQPFGVAASRDGSRVYVTMSWGSVLEIDTASNTVLRSIPVGVMPAGEAAGVAVDGARRVIVANFLDDSVSIFSPQANPVSVQSPAVGPLGLAFGIGPSVVSANPTADLAYAVKLDGTVQQIDAAHATVSAPPWSVAPYLATSAEIVPSGAIGSHDKRVYVVSSCTAAGACSEGDSTITIFDGVSGARVKTCTGLAQGLQAFGEFLTREPPPAIPVALCPKSASCRILQSAPILEKACAGDPLNCLPVACCGASDPGSQSPGLPQVVAARIAGARVNAAGNVEVRRPRTSSFVPLKPGTVLRQGDLLRITAKSHLEVTGKGVEIRASMDTDPQSAGAKANYLMLVVSAATP